MAKNNIVISMLLNNSDFVKKMGMSWKQTKDFEKSINKTSGALSQMAKGGLAPVVGKLTAFAGGAALVGGALSRSTEKMIALDSALSDMKALLGATDEQMVRFKESALKMASNSVVAADDIIKAMIKVGGAMPQLLDFEQGLKNVTQSAITLSEASGMSLDDSINSLTSIMNQFGASAMESDRYINALSAAAQAGSAEIDYLATAVAKAGGAATTADLDFEELLSLIEAVAPKFGKAEEAGTALRGVLLKMETGEKRTKISTQGLSKALDELTKLNADEMLKKFGVEGFNMAKAMVDARDAFEKFNTEVRGTEAAQEQAMIRADNLRGSIDLLANKWDAFTLAINNSNGPLKTFVDLCGEAVDKMADLASGGDEQARWLRSQKSAMDKAAPKDASDLVRRWEKMGLSKEDAINKAMDDVWSHIQVFEGKGQVGSDNRNAVKVALEGILGSRWTWKPGDSDLSAGNFGASFNDNLAYPLAKYGGPLAGFLGGGALAKMAGAGLFKTAFGGVAGATFGAMGTGQSSKDVASTLNTLFPTGEMSDMLGLYKWYQMQDYLKEYQKSLKVKTTTTTKTGGGTTTKDPLGAVRADLEAQGFNTKAIEEAMRNADLLQQKIKELDAAISANANNPEVQQGLTHLRDSYKALLGEVKESEQSGPIMIAGLDVTDIVATQKRVEELEGQIQKLEGLLEFDSDARLVAKIKELKAELAKLKPEIKEITKSGNLPTYTNPWKKNYQDNWQNGNAYQRIGFASDAAGTVANGMNSIGNLISRIPGLDEAGEAIGTVTSAIMEVISVIQAVSAIIEMVQGVSAVKEIAATTSNTAAIIGNTATIGSLIGALAANSAFNAIPFCSDGGIIGGSSWTGDKLLARVNSGEMVLNAKQQKNLLAGLNNASGTIGSVIGPSKIQIKGEDLWVSLDNYSRRTKGKKL